jgi:hypothetical protein
MSDVAALSVPVRRTQMTDLAAPAFESGAATAELAATVGASGARPWVLAVLARAWTGSSSDRPTGRVTCRSSRSGFQRGARSLAASCPEDVACRATPGLWRDPDAR